MGLKGIPPTISTFREVHTESVEMAGPDDEVEGFLSPREAKEKEKEEEDSKKGKACLHKFTLPQPFDGVMKDTKSFISSIILYIHGRKAEFKITESKAHLQTSANKYILQFKAEASQTNLGDLALVEYLKTGLNPLLFKSIY